MPSSLNVPCFAISVAAVRKPVQAARASAPPTLIRRTPIAVRSATVAKSPPTRTLTGFGATARTTAAMSSRLRRPGAYKHSAPASAYAVMRRIVSFRSGRPTMNPSERPVSRYARAALVDRPPGGADPFDREREVEQRVGRIARRVLDRYARDARRHRARHVGRRRRTARWQSRLRSRR